MAEASEYDLMIIGTGPAGLTAALYGQRLGMRCVVFGDIPGGNLYMVENLANFPGFPGGIAGTEWGVKAFQQAQMEGAMFTMSRLETLDKPGAHFSGRDVNGISYTAPCVIVASGRVPKRLPVAHAQMKGVNFCSVCDGPLYRGKNATLAVVGSDNAAAQHALTLARIAGRVWLICRSETVAMDAAHKTQIAGNPTITLRTGTEVTGYEGLDFVEALTAKSPEGVTERISVDGVFLAIGWTPNTEMIALAVETVADGYLKTDATLMTSVPGLFAAGDVRDTDLWQVLTSCADGARAAKHAAAYVQKAG